LIFFRPPVEASAVGVEATAVAVESSSGMERLTSSYLAV